MSEIRNCPGCGQPRFGRGKGTHLHNSRLECVAADPGESTITFWKGNKVDAEFTWPIGAVVDAFLPQYNAESDWPVERQLRNFLTDPLKFDSVWEDEEAFSELLTAARVAVIAKLSETET